MARTPLFRVFIRLLAQAQTSPVQNGSLQPRSLRRKSVLSRRQLLKYSALAGGTALGTAVGIPALAQSFPHINRSRIAIVGGGIAGLNAAYQLRKLGIRATVYEAKTYVGGRIQSRQTGVGRNLVTDLGGSFINTNHADILALVEEFDLKLFDRVADAASVPFPEVAFHFDDRSIPEFEMARNLRPLAEQIGRDATRLDQNFELAVQVFDRLSVTDYLNIHADKIPQPYVRTLVENSIRTEYGVEPQDSTALQLLYNLPTVTIAGVQVISSDEAYTVQGGSGQIIQRLAQALDGQIQTRHRLQSIQSRGHAFWLSFANRVTVEADYVILATPFTALRQVDLRVNLPPALRRFIQAVNLGLNEKLLAEFRDRVWRQEDGFTQEAWTDFGCSEIWEDSQRQPAVKAGVLTFYLGGNEVQVPYPSVKIQGQTFVNQLNAVLPGIRRASSDRYFRTGWTQDPDIGGSYTSFQPGQYLEFSNHLYIESRNPAERQNVNVGNLVFAGEQFSDEFYGFMNGAAQTGRLAAALVLSRMHQV